MEDWDDNGAHYNKKFSHRLDWNLLKNFQEIVHARGITAAANAGWHKQSTVSLALQRLESILGSRLCHRGRRGFELTDEGRILYEYIRKACDNIDEAESAIANSKDNISGEIRICVISNFSSNVLNTILQTYNEQCPAVSIKIDVLTWDNISKIVVNNDYDVGITPISYRRADLKYSFLEREYHNIYCGKDHRLFGVMPEIGSLSGEQFILTGSDEPESLTRFRLRHGLGERVTARTPSLEEAKRLAIAGVGLCILPQQMVAEDAAKGSLWPLMTPSDEASCDIYIITNINAPKKRSKDMFIQLAEGLRNS